MIISLFDYRVKGECINKIPTLSIMHRIFTGDIGWDPFFYRGGWGVQEIRVDRRLGISTPHGKEREIQWQDP
jgi:hypothetical protein